MAPVKVDSYAINMYNTGKTPQNETFFCNTKMAHRGLSHVFLVLVKP